MNIQSQTDPNPSHPVLSVPPTPLPPPSPLVVVDLRVSINGTAFASTSIGPIDPRHPLSQKGCADILSNLLASVSPALSARPPIHPSVPPHPAPFTSDHLRQLAALFDSGKVVLSCSRFSDPTSDSRSWVVIQCDQKKGL